ncbi:MAG TPA: NAD(P)H-dependent oxidoreductase [Myxococcaceae bacterium]|jgi:chromate reductase
MTAPRILGICGSLRTGSFNRQLLNVAVEYAREAGAEVEVYDLKAARMPWYDADVDALGPPPPVLELRDQIVRAQGMIIVSPEYNYSIPGALKNAIDWVSRVPGRPFENKWVALMGASTGPYGTARMQPDMRKVMAGLGTYVLPAQVMLPHAQQAFTEQGALKDPARQQEVAKLIKALVDRARG